MSDYISRADAIEAVAKLNRYDVDERNRLRGYTPFHGLEVRSFIEVTDLYDALYALPSADAVPQSEQYKKGFEDCKRAYEIELARSADAVHTCNTCADKALCIMSAPDGNWRACKDYKQADAVQGEWQKVEEQPYFRKHYDTVCCSLCRKKGNRKWNFCPNCGARMKGGAE